MKAIFDKIVFKKEVETKFGTMFQFRVDYLEKMGTFLAKKKEQTTFVEGAENEFTETENIFKGVTYYNLKAIKKEGYSNFSRQVKKEQSRYSGFGTSYAKDLVVAGKIGIDEMFPMAQDFIDFMVRVDKAIENG